MNDVIYGIEVRERKGGQRSCSTLELRAHAADDSRLGESWVTVPLTIKHSPPVVQLFPSVDQPLLVRRDPFFILNYLLQHVDSVTRENFTGQGLPSQSFDKDLHWRSCGLCGIVAQDQILNPFETKLTEFLIISELFILQQKCLIYRRDINETVDSAFDW